MGETLRSLRAWAGRVARLMLGYTPPPEPPVRRRGELLAWLASGGGHGAVEIYSYGLALGVMLSLALMSYAIRDALVSDEPGDDGALVGWSIFVMVLLYLVGAGFVAARRGGSIARGAVVGAVTAAIGVGLAYLTFVVILLVAYHQPFAVAILPILLPFVAIGFLSGTLGGALALPGAAYRAIREGLEEP